jgi:hypothetical protein
MAAAIILVVVLRGTPGRAEVRIAASVAQELLARSLLCPLPVPDGQAYIRKLLRGTRFERRWQINRRLREDYINLYFFCSDGAPASENLTQDYANNCALVGAPNIVICDAGFFRRLAVTKNLAGGVVTLPQVERNLFIWVIGHEMGHVLHGDAPSHFGADKLSELVPNATLDQSREIAADDWFATRLASFSDELLIENTLVRLIFAEVAHKVGGENIHPGTGMPIVSNFIDYANASTHPEMIIRAVRILAIRYNAGENKDKEIMAYEINRFIQILRLKK